VGRIRLDGMYEEDTQFILASLFATSKFIGRSARKVDRDFGDVGYASNT
jgi:hypothetical protein